MTHALYLPGFGSTPESAQTVAQQLSEYYDKDFEGIHLRKSLALKQGFFNNREIITMSGGLYSVREATPHSLIAIAAPVVENRLRLLKRARKLNAKLEAEHSEKEHGNTLKSEVMPHVLLSLRLLLQLGGFNSLEAARDMQERGTSVEMAFMAQDGLFQLDREEVGAEIEATRQVGVPVSIIEGHHNDFTHDPVDILNRLALRQTVSLPDTIPSIPGYIPAVI